MNQTQYGLVLAGGGAKGAYQIGLWQALRELEIPLCAVTGTSIGALNGALIAQGDWDAAREVWKSVSLHDIVTLPEESGNNLFTARNARFLARAFLRERGLDTGPLRKLLCRCVDEKKVRASAVNFGLVTFSLTDLAPQELFLSQIEEGKLIDYLLASACFPIFKNVEIDGKKYVDGGVYDNAPASMLVRHGYRDLIVVEIGGIGPVRRVTDEGVRQIHLQAEGLGGLFDLTPETIERSIRLGHLDGLRAFGALCGTHFCFSPQEREALGDADALERAGELYGLSALEIYTAETFRQALAQKHRMFSEQYRTAGGAGVMELARSLSRRQMEFSQVIPLLMERYFAGEATERDLRLARRFAPKELAAAQAVRQALGL